jgi:S-adenosylmethionine-diacylglycerol 3-amino-3-carboxypropyl transferase
LRARVQALRIQAVTARSELHHKAVTFGTWCAPPTCCPGSAFCKDSKLKSKLTLGDRIDQKVFTAIYARSLVYNTCWEDPAVDRQALRLSGKDTVLAITSAGCNVLDYALTGPQRIHAVDANPRQTALLELKLAGIRRLDHNDFFSIFGQGYHPQFVPIYQDLLREELSPFARDFWDYRTSWFSGRYGGFYFHGLAGTVARGFRTYLKLRPGLACYVDQLFNATTVDEQREVYDAHIAPRMWGFWMNWALSRQVTLSMLGVPHPQRREVVAQHTGGVAGFIRESLEYLARNLPFRDNYFYTVYVRGSYSARCCPEYLKPTEFARLKHGLAARIVPHTCTVTEFLQRHDEPISRFVLLDHMDWMSSYYPEALVAEWTAILQRATPDARVIFRSAHAQPRYLDRITLGAACVRLRDILRFDAETARELTRQDRVHTYAGFHIADVMA